MARVPAGIVAAEGAGIRGDAVFTYERYIGHMARARCAVVVYAGELARFQVPTRARDGTLSDLPAGRGIIGRHLSPGGPSGVGRARFAASRSAVQARLATIDATVATDNAACPPATRRRGFAPGAADGSVAKRHDCARTPFQRPQAARRDPRMIAPRRTPR